MEKLEITNFLAIEHAEIEIKKINLFIGPQAQGKSLISKLIYFFKEYPRTMIEAVLRGIQTKDGFDRFTLAKFEKIFPRYTWRNDAFKVYYSCDQFSISIANIAVDNKVRNDPKFALALESDDIIFTSFENLLVSNKNNDIGLTAFYDDVLMASLQTNCLQQSLYVPAGRSLLATLENNIFAFISSEIKIDYFLTLFGKYYGDVKETIKEGHYDRLEEDEEEKETRIKKLVKQIICGDFLLENDQSWIVNENRKTYIADASSGQQEALPMVLLLSTVPYHQFLSTRSYPLHFVIEEPEAHLFPISQNDIVLLIANAYNNLRDFKRSSSGVNSFTIATHSPYILTAFNNLIQAGNVAASKNYQDLDELRAVVPESEWVDFNDVTAYVVNNGTVKSILNQELKLIDANMIDEVSDDLAAKFEKLICMESVDEQSV